MLQYIQYVIVYTVCYSIYSVLQYIQCVTVYTVRYSIYCMILTHCMTKCKWKQYEISNTFSIATCSDLVNLSQVAPLSWEV